MSSKATLVNPNPTHVRLVFSKNSTLNANLLINGELRYIVSTADRHAQHTKVIDAISKTEIASVRKRTFLSDKITFTQRQGGAPQKLADVMRKHRMEDGYEAYMIRTERGDFYWRIHPVHRLAFFSILDPENPVAYREAVSSPISTFALVFQRGSEGLIDYIIPTFLILEQQLRMGEKEANIAEGTSADNRTVLGMYVTKGNS